MNNFDNEFERAIRFITEAMPFAEHLEKPTLFHSLRVGLYLYSHNYSREICIAGLLHDAIEDTQITEEVIENAYGKEIAAIVVANSKDETLHGDEKYMELLKQCIAYGEPALIVKAADIMDNHLYYTRIKESGGLAYTRKITSLLMKNKPQEYTDSIFKTLEEIVQ